MAKKAKREGREGATRDGNDASGVNLRGARRRRLLRAIGGSGGIALTSVLSSQWTKPVVSSVLLPAHAQTTLSNEPCPISMEATFGPTSTNNSDTLAYSVSLAVFEPNGNTTFLGQSTEGTGGSVSLAGNGIFPPAAGSYSLGMEFEGAELASYSAALNASCCDDSRASPDIGFIGFVTGSSSIRFVTIDDGSCTFLNP